MKPIFILGCLFLTLGCAKTPALKTQQTLLEVGGQRWTNKDFSTRLIQAAKTLSVLELSDGKSLNTLKETVVKNLIVESLLIQWDKASKEPIAKEAVQEHLLSLQKDYVNEKSFMTENSLSHAEKDTFVSRAHARLAKEKLLKGFRAYADIDKGFASIQKQYWSDKAAFVQPEKIRLQQIVLKNQSEAIRVYQALKEGAVFGELAKKYSLGLEAEQEGRLGWVKRGSFKPFDHAFSLPLKKASKPIASAYGFHIFKVLAKRKSSKMSLDSVKEQFREKALRLAKRKLYKEWLEKQLSKTTILKNEAAIRTAKIHSSGGKL